jgi:putative membrane protein
MMAVLMMAVLPRVAPDRHADAPMRALYLWTYGSSVLAHAVFLHLPASAAWGALGMGLVAIPLAVAWCSGW